jgi:DNA-directed RNA polymerase specialized sigma24 family protein
MDLPGPNTGGAPRLFRRDPPNSLQRMHIDDPKIYESLAKLIHAKTKDPTLREDLNQEALVHLWLTERKNPGHTLSWYLQSCRFHIQHLLHSGRSLDSPKRRHLGCQITCDPAQDSALDQVLRLDANTHEHVDAQDLRTKLFPRLKARDRLLLYLLADGYSIREIAELLGLTHPAILKRVNRIALAAANLGFSRAA